MPTRDSLHVAGSGQTALASALEVSHVAKVVLMTVAGMVCSSPSPSVHASTLAAQNMQTVSPVS